MEGPLSRYPRLPELDIRVQNDAVSSQRTLAGHVVIISKSLREYSLQ